MRERLNAHRSRSAESEGSTLREKQPLAFLLINANREMGRGRREELVNAGLLEDRISHCKIVNLHASIWCLVQRLSCGQVLVIASRRKGAKVEMQVHAALAWTGMRHSGNGERVSPVKEAGDHISQDCGHRISLPSHISFYRVSEREWARVERKDETFHHKIIVNKWKPPLEDSSAPQREQATCSLSFGWRNIWCFLCCW